jgi:hypothetical protein
MTWNELKKYIEAQEEYFLDQPVKLYDFETGDEFFADVTELHGNDGWIPYISINTEVKDGKAQETGID